jgi:hypothetical protein
MDAFDTRLRDRLETMESSLRVEVRSQARARAERRWRAPAVAAIALLASAAVFSTPALSRGDNESRLRDFGVPAGAEIVATQADADGNFLMVMYRDSSGQVVTLGGIERLHTPPPTP